MRRRPAFTLVELLVVVAIIALLLSILLPALNKARDLAKETVCMSSLRQYALGWFAYSRDYRNMPAGQKLEATLDLYLPAYADLFSDPEPGELACPVAYRIRLGNLRRVMYGTNFHLGHRGVWLPGNAAFGRAFAEIDAAEVAHSVLVLMFEGANYWDKSGQYRCAHPAHMNTIPDRMYDPDPTIHNKVHVRLHLNGSPYL